MKRLRLVQLPVPPPAALAATGNVPLAAGCLAVAAKVEGLGARLELEVVPPALTDVYGDTLLADRLARDEPEFLGLSLYLWNCERSLHLAREVKRRSPRTAVVIGGPEVSPDSPFVLGQQGFDVAVTGEGEQTFAALMARLVDGRDVAGLPNVAVRTAAGLSPWGPAPAGSFDLTRYPSPYLEGLVAVDPTRSTYVETVRGCRSQCTFCFYPGSSSALRVLELSRCAELIASLKEQGAREVVFLDPTFNHRPDFERLLAALEAANPTRALAFFAEVRAERLTGAHAAALARAGFNRLELGLQSVNPLTLKRVKRGGSPGQVAAAAKLLHAEGLQLLVDLIVGLPGDTADDVLRGIDFLDRHGLGDEAQVFSLAVLPGTALRAEAARDGVEFEPAPPYRVRRTATMDSEAIARVLLQAEERLDRRLDELPRPHLVEAGSGGGPPDVFQPSLDAVESAAPGAQHVALWIDAPDLFEARGAISKAIDARLAVDPYATLDVVLVARGPFPLDLLELVRARLDAGTPSYLSRALAGRGEDLQRRITVVLPSSAGLSGDWVDAVRQLVPVFRDQSLRQAAADAAELGERLPAARILDRDVERSDWLRLAELADPAAVAFANRALEARWLHQLLGFGDLLSGGR